MGKSRTNITWPVSARSIAEAKADVAQERLRLYFETGVIIDDNGKGYIPEPLEEAEEPREPVAVRVAMRRRG